MPGASLGCGLVRDAIAPARASAGGEPTGGAAEANNSDGGTGEKLCHVVRILEFLLTIFLTSCAVID